MALLLPFYNLYFINIKKFSGTFLLPFHLKKEPCHLHLTCPCLFRFGSFKQGVKTRLVDRQAEGFSLFAIASLYIIKKILK